MDSISLGLKSRIPPCNGTPSTTYKGSVEVPLVPKDAIPLILTEGVAPGCPSLLTATPATRPCNICVTSFVATLVISAVLTELTAPVRSDRFSDPYPTTTTSCKDVTSGVREILITV